MGRTIFLALLLLATCWHSAGAQAPFQARVVSCYDGDTCTLDHEILPGRDRVRVRGADAPEIKAHCAAEKRLALAARQFTTSRLVGRTVLLEDVREDKYPKRVDAYVIMPDGRDLGEALISAGLARPYDGGQRQSWCADQWQ
jgi:micrococcal nuclease